MQAQNAAIKAGAQGQQIAPATRTLFNEAGKQIGEVPGDVIKGYGGRAKQQAAPQQDPFAGIAAKIAADKAAGKPVDYNALAALQHARSQTNTEARNMAMREFMKKYPQFAKPGGSQGVVLGSVTWVDLSLVILMATTKVVQQWKHLLRRSWMWRS